MLGAWSAVCPCQLRCFVLISLENTVPEGHESGKKNQYKGHFNEL